MAGTQVGEVYLGLGLDSTKFDKQMSNLGSNTQKTVDKSFGGIGKKIGAALGAAALGSFVKDCLDLGSDLAEVQNVVDVSFATMSSKVNEFAQNAASQFGLSETMAKQFTGTFGTMAQSMGLTEAAAYDMSTALTGMAGDVASFYNMSHEEAYTKLKSVFTGETESLKDLGWILQLLYIVICICKRGELVNARCVA